MIRRKHNYLFLILLVLSIIILFLNTVPGINIIKGIGMIIVYPVNKVINYPWDKMKKTSMKINSIINLYQENNKLKNQITQMEKRYSDLEYLKQNNKELRDRLNFRLKSERELVPAEVIIHKPENYFTEFSVNKGISHGIKKDDPVISVKESKWILIGRVDNVFDKFSQIALITSANFRCGVRISRKYRGVCIGKNDWDCRLKYISPNAEINKGDPVYTSGTGKIFPQGLYIGEVVEVENLKYSKGKEADVKLARHPQNIKYVYIIKQ